MLSSMRRQQDEMRKTLQGLEAILIRAGELDVLHIGDIRTALIVQLKAYTEFKHTTVFPALIGSSDPVIAALAALMRSRCDRMADFIRGNLKEWPINRVVEQRALYRGVALDMIGRLRQHFVREEADVVRLTERPPSHSQPASGAHAV